MRKRSELSPTRGRLVPSPFGRRWPRTHVVHGRGSDPAVARGGRGPSSGVHTVYVNGSNFTRTCPRISISRLPRLHPPLKIRSRPALRATSTARPVSYRRLVRLQFSAPPSPPCSRSSTRTSPLRNDRAPTNERAPHNRGQAPLNAAPTTTAGRPPPRPRDRPILLRKLTEPRATHAQGQTSRGP